MSNPFLVDSHCHLDFPDFDGEIPEIITRAKSAGVARMVTICTRPQSLEKVVGIAEAHEEVYFAYGIHPMNAHEGDLITVEALEEVANHPKMVGIGETGLDYHYSADSKERQQESLRIHCEAARRTQLPLIIHSRDADEDMIDILSSEHAKGAYPCVLHCFSSGPELAKAALDMGFYLSMSGIATFKRSQDVRDIFEAAPVERILVETDSPYLAPPPHRGKRNEPAYTALTAQTGAQIYHMSTADFALQTTRNFNRLFSKAAIALPESN